MHENKVKHPKAACVRHAEGVRQHGAERSVAPKQSAARSTPTRSASEGHAQK
ncbi:MAG: hypothetical protein NZ455_12910 [Bacteroidia bacterium]|nr:hypothetical protein [Bacteroidia bacterium]MDW8347144.1 hypothetical protein [Bacteroidia bacterium]